MNKKLYFLIPVFVVVAVVALSVGIAVAARPNFQAADVSNPATGEAKNTVTIPATAVEGAPNIFYLGEAAENGKSVEGYAFVDYQKGFGKPSGCNDDGKCQGWEDPNSCGDCAGGGGGEPNGSSCYDFLSKGAKWHEVEDYIVNPTNGRGLDETFVRSNLVLDISKWEDAADGLVDGNITKDILGDEVSGEVNGADLASPDNQNEVYFADVESSGAIAVTIVWGIFRGKPSERELVEWDQVYDDVDFDWGASGEEGKMDFENIATHELGHSVGLDDLYEDKCTEQTMYGYAAYGETKKRSLEVGDITGIQKLYGE